VWLILLFLLLAQIRPATAEEGYISTSDGTRLFYQKAGTGRQTAIFPLGFLVYDDFRFLGTGDRTVIFYDVRNRGRSDSISNPDLIGLQHDVEDVETVRRYFKLDRFDIIGYSYLGKVVVLYALQHPQQIGRIIQLGPVPMKFGTQYAAELQAVDQNDPASEKELQKLRSLREKNFHKTHPKEYCEMEWSLLRRQLVGNPANAEKISANICQLSNEWPIHLANHFEALLPTDQKLPARADEVAKLNIPVLIIHGTADRNAPYGSGREWASTLPNARLLTVPGAGHQSWADAPNLIFPAITEFLNGRWPEKAEKIVRK
jgi:proline iminopeptidase